MSIRLQSIMYSQIEVTSFPSRLFKSVFFSFKSNLWNFPTFPCEKINFSSITSILFCFFIVTIYSIATSTQIKGFKTTSNNHHLQDATSKNKVCDCYNLSKFLFCFELLWYGLHSLLYLPCNAIISWTIM